MSGSKSLAALAPIPTPDIPPSSEPVSDACEEPSEPTSSSKKKKKKKNKPKAKVVKVPLTSEEKEEALNKAAEALAIEERQAKPRVPLVEKNGVLKISRLKHWKYISAYHGPWLQLPVELLESLFSLNVDPISLSSLASSRLVNSLHPKMIAGTGKERAKKAQPPPIDPGVFRSVIDIRRCVDEASDLAIRASSGLSAFSACPAGAQSLQPDRPTAKNGREPNMSAIRTHRLRVMACQRLAEAFATDEIASAVMVMQGATALDDVADKVLRIEPDNPDARYVQFFQEKIPSRMVSENTTTQTLDNLILSHPNRLEFYRTRGIVKAFLNQFAGAARDYTHALVEARALRKGRQAHSREEAKSQSKKERARKASSHSHFRTEESDDSPSGSDEIPRARHPSTLPEAPLPLEPQCLFLRASSYLLHAVWLIESETLNLEGIDRGSDGGIDLRLCNLTHGRYGGVDLGNPNGPLGSRTGKKFIAYRARFNTPKFRATIETLARKSIRDHERFLSHFGEIDVSAVRSEQPFSSDLDVSRPQTPFNNSSSSTSYDHSAPFPFTASGNPSFTTYHPLLVESHYSILLNHLLLGDFTAALAVFQKVCALAEGGLEGYPVFLPARSMAQAEFNEVMDRLLTGWGLGQGPPTAAPAVCAQPGFLTLGLSADTKLAIMPSPSASSPSLDEDPVPSTSTAPSSSTSPSASDSVPSSSTLALSVRSSSGKGSARPPPPPLDLEAELRSLKLLVILLAKKSREKRMKEAETHAQLRTKPSLGSMIPLSGPRVEVILIWLGATILADLEEDERRVAGF